jgi:hypothetical protein
MRISRPRQDPADTPSAASGVGSLCRPRSLEGQADYDDDFKFAAGLAGALARLGLAPMRAFAAAHDVQQFFVVQGTQPQGLGVAHH